MRNQRSLVVAAGIAALLIPAGAAQAATKQVTIGPAKPLKGVQLVGFDADFYPRKITIAKGDHIRFKWTTGFGDVIFVPKGQDAPSFAAPAGTVADADAKDEAGVSRGLLHYHFGTKEKLLAEVVKRDADIRMAALDRALEAAHTADELVDLLSAARSPPVGRPRPVRRAGPRGRGATA